MSEKTGNKFVIEECEKLLGQVRDVISARIVADSDGTIREIHLLAGENRSPKQIVRDIESVFMAHFGMSIDHKKISIAQLDGGETKKKNEKRLRFLGLSFSSTGQKAEVKVSLQYGDGQFEGVFTGPRSRHNTLRLTAHATLGAVEQCINSELFFAVEDVVVSRVGKNDVVNAAISILSQKGEDILVGTALVNNDEREATARAVLDALNRRFPYMVETSNGKAAE